jgi:hypothetical protein
MAIPPRARTIILTDARTVAFSSALAAYDGTVASPPSAPTPTPAPSFTSQPSISGTVKVGQSLSAMTFTDGTVSNGAITSRAILLAGVAKAGTYVLVDADVGKAVTYRNVATGTGNPATATSAAVTVQAVDVTPTLRISNAQSIAEGGSGAIYFIYTVTLSAAAGSGGVTVPWTFAAGGTSASDFAGGSYPTGGSVNIAVGDTTGTFSIAVAGDTAVEGDETFTVAISAPAGYVAGALVSATGTIVNDDVPSVTPKVVGEGDSITQYDAASSGWDSYARIYKAAHPFLNMTVTAVGGSSLGNPGDPAGTNSMYARLDADQALQPTHVTFMIGANDDVSGAYLNRVLAYATIWKNAGVKVIVGTVLPRASGPNNANRGAFNAGLRAAVGNQFAGLFDFDTIPAGADGAGANVALYPDGLHRSAAAQGQMARVYATEMNWQLGIANEPLDFSFAAAMGAAANTDVESAAYTVTGLHAGESRPYQAAAGVYVSKNDGAYVLAGSGTVVSGNTLKVRVKSSGVAAARVDGAVTVGTTSATFSVTTAGAGSRPYVETDLGAKLAMLLLPEAIAGADTEAMESWPDSSGKNVAVVGYGGGGSARPVVRAASLNGYKAAQTGPGWFRPPASLVAGRTSMATFFVVKLSADPSVGVGSPVGGWGSNDGDFYTYTNGGIYSGYGSTSRRDNVNPVPSLADWHMGMFYSAPGDWRLYLNGDLILRDTTNIVSPGNSPQIGQSNGDAMNGLIVELGDCSVAPSDLEIDMIFGRLADKYALRSLLRADHPFKSAKPTTNG